MLDLVTFLVFLVSVLGGGAVVYFVSVQGAREKTYDQAKQEQAERRRAEEEHKRAVAKANKAKQAAKKAKKHNLKQLREDEEEAAAAAAAAAAASPLQDHEQPVEKEQPLVSTKKKRKKTAAPAAPVVPAAVVVQPPPPPDEAEAPSSSSAVLRQDTLEVHRTYLQEDAQEESRSNTPLLSEEPASGAKEMAIPEESPQSTPEPPVTKKAAAKAAAKKAKMHIEEVEEAPVVADSVEQLAAAVDEPAKPSPRATNEAAPAGKKANQSSKKAKKESQTAGSEQAPSAGGKTSGKLSPSELISVVKKTPFDDSEAQQLIDILLNKQAGSPNQNGDWVDTSSGKSHGSNDFKQLQKALADKDQVLQDQETVVKGLTQKLSGLRQELSVAKNSQVAIQRQKEDNEANMKKEIIGLQNRLQAQTNQSNREIGDLTAQLQYQRTKLATLTSPQIDPKVMTELDQLRSTKTGLESQVASLKDKLAAAERSNSDLSGRLKSTESQLEHSSSVVSKEKASLESALAEASRVKDETEKAKSEIEQSKALVEKDKAELEQRVSDLKSEVKASSEEASRLQEENERLSEQLSSQMERPRTEGQESHNGSVENGHSSASPQQHELEVAEKEAAAWQKKYQILLQEKDTLIEEKESGFGRLQSEVSEYQAQVQRIQADLDSQKAKNDELRSKNWKAMDALSKAEQSYGNLLKQSQSGKSEDLSGAISKAQRDSENAHKALLKRLFPEVSQDDQQEETKDYESWVQCFAEKVKKTTLEVAQQVPSPKEDESVEHLKKQVTHYKTVLAQTESMLNQLQASVESAEDTWKSRVSDLERKNAALQESLSVVNQAEESLAAGLKSGPPSLGVHFALGAMEQALPTILDEMQVKLQELQTKLSEEEEEKNSLLSKFNTAEKRLADQHKVQEELSSLRGKYDAECAKSTELGTQVARMNQLLTTSQEALEAEQRTVEMLRQANQKLQSRDGPASPASSRLLIDSALSSLKDSNNEFVERTVGLSMTVSREKTTTTTTKTSSSSSTNPSLEELLERLRTGGKSGSNSTTATKVVSSSSSSAASAEGRTLRIETEMANRTAERLSSTSSEEPSSAAEAVTTSENGPRSEDKQQQQASPASPSSSQVGSVASLDLSDNSTPVKTKSFKKKKLFGLISKK